MAQEQKHKQSGKESEEVEETEDVPTESLSDTEEVDDLLDDIDSVLEENAEEFILSYVQQGGE